jgi:alpha-L-rhamnosidase
MDPGVNVKLSEVVPVDNEKPEGDSSLKRPTHRGFGRTPDILSRAEMLSLFKEPPRDFAPIPFHFWNGERLNRERLGWQLEQLSAQGIGGTIVSYTHRPDVSLDPGDPAVFSEEWWELFAWFLQKSKSLGMVVGVQDYCIVTPILEALAAEFGELRGATLHQVHAEVTAGETARLELPREAELVSLRAFPRWDQRLDSEGSADLGHLLQDGRLEWRAPSGEWTVVAVFASSAGFNPLHPSSGRRAIERLYAPFEQRCPDEIGQTLAVFFQDELDFGNRMPRWSTEVSTAFEQRKGYPLGPELAALWFDLGSRTEKVRIDYADVVTSLAEEHYFGPIFDWHEQHGTLFGHDNFGRGEIRDSFALYGDPFRTMRWFSAPGCDDPHLEGPRRFAGFKVHSSIAHLYHRPRVWNEGFYGSGWGVTPAQLLSALNEDFVYGATLYNPHAVYYTTLGGWWEWAPPDTHFRQPYWPMTRPLWEYTTRLSALLASGQHSCDVAIVYPSTDLEAGFSEASDGYIALAQTLFEAGLDFDFIDFESLERAEIQGDQLCVAGESYKVLIFPAAQAVRHSSLEQAAALKRAGGTVLAYGRAPSISERSGRNDPQVEQLVAALFGAAADAPLNSHAEVLERINASIERDFISDTANVCVLHRVIGDQDLYFVFNKNPDACRISARFRAQGNAEIWDAWTGSAEHPQESTGDGPYQTLTLTLEAKGATLVVFDRTRVARSYQTPRFVPVQTLELSSTWEAEITPLLDNRFADFRFPASEGLLRPELRRFRHLETDAQADCSAPEFPDHDWPEVMAGYGTQFWQLGPVPSDPGLEARLLELEEVDPGQPVVWGNQSYHWREYGFSERYGIEADPLLSHWLTGPHGLKGQVPGEFLDVGQGAQDSPHGENVYLWTTVTATQPQLNLAASSRAVYKVWLNAQEKLSQDSSLGAAVFQPWDVPDYRAPIRQLAVDVLPGRQRLLMRLTLESTQRTRGFLVASHQPIETERHSLELPWFGPALSFDHRPQPSPQVHWLRCVSPPGSGRLTVVAYGQVSAWINGQPLQAAGFAVRSDGARTYQFAPSASSASPSTLALRVESASRHRAGAVLAEAVLVEGRHDSMPAGDWTALGLPHYSGGVTYRQDFVLEPLQPGQRLHLVLGKLGVAAKVRLNGHEAGIVLAEPWTLDVSPWVQGGSNHLEVLVANTLANEFATRPSPYVDPTQMASGLMGVVRLVRMATP